jgi:guanylate kinase
MERGDLFLISAPSGAGKTTLVRKLLAQPGFAGGHLHYSVSHTTRAPRPGELEGVAYHFVDQDRFGAMIGRDEFLEHAEVHGNLYGTSKGEVLPHLERATDVLLDVDVQGAEQVMARMPGAVSVFILPPSYGELEARLRGRASDSAEAVAGRLGVALAEVRRYPHYRYVIVNDDADRAGAVLASIILAQRHRTERRRDDVERIAASFTESEP